MTMDFLPDGITINAMDGRCYTCGDPHRKGQKAFAAKAFEDFLGRVEICDRCIRKAADKLNLMPADKHELVKANNDRLWRDNLALVEEITLLKEGRVADAHLHESEVQRLKIKLQKAKAGAE